MGVMRLGLVHLRVTDLEEAREHYSNSLGMTVVAEQPGKLYLKCWDEWDHHSPVLEEGGVGLVKLGYKCQTAADLERFERRSQRFGATTSRVSKGENLTVGDGERSFAGGYRTGPDFPTITWTEDQLGKGVFYVTREPNDRFTTVFT
jgi:catechol 2,3-dioxygenase